MCMTGGGHGHGHGCCTFGGGMRHFHGCCCGGMMPGCCVGMGFRRFISPAEELERLQDYLEELKKRDRRGRGADQGIAEAEIKERKALKAGGTGSYPVHEQKLRKPVPPDPPGPLWSIGLS